MGRIEWRILLEVNYLCVQTTTALTYLKRSRFIRDKALVCTNVENSGLKLRKEYQILLEGRTE
jgi:hypothetical protein